MVKFDPFDRKEIIGSLRVKEEFIAKGLGEFWRTLPHFDYGGDCICQILGSVLLDVNSASVNMTFKIKKKKKKPHSRQRGTKEALPLAPAARLPPIQLCLPSICGVPAFTPALGRESTRQSTGDSTALSWRGSSSGWGKNSETRISNGPAQNSAWSGAKWVGKTDGHSQRLCLWTLAIPKGLYGPQKPVNYMERNAV